MHLQCLDLNLCISPPKSMDEVHGQGQRPRPRPKTVTRGHGRWPRPEAPWPRATARGHGQRPWPRAMAKRDDQPPPHPRFPPRRLMSIPARHSAEMRQHSSSSTRHDHHPDVPQTSMGYLGVLTGDHTSERHAGHVCWRRPALQRTQITKIENAIMI